jgi:hypothetical protein
VIVRFVDIAEAELDDAIRWSHAQAPGLGDAFLLLVPYKGELKMWPVVRERIGNIRNKAAEVVEAISEGS